MQLQFISFKIGSLWSNTAIPALLPLFTAVEEAFTRDVIQSPRRSCLDVFNCPKMMSFGFWAWGIKRNRTEPSQGCTVGGEVLWYYFEPKIPRHQINSSGPVSHKFFSCRSSVMIRWTSVSGSSTSSAINRTFKRRSLSRTTFTRATLFSFLEVERRPVHCSSSLLSLPFLNALCHPKTWDEDKTASP